MIIIIMIVLSFLFMCTKFHKKYFFLRENSLIDAQMKLSSKGLALKRFWCFFYLRSQSCFHLDLTLSSLRLVLDSILASPSLGLDNGGLDHSSGYSIYPIACSFIHSCTQIMLTYQHLIPMTNIILVYVVTLMNRQHEMIAIWTYFIVNY